MCVGTKGIDDWVRDRVDGTNQFAQEAKNDLSDLERTKLEKDYNCQATDVGITKAISGGLSAAKNLVDAPNRALNEKIEDVQDFIYNVRHGEKVASGYKNIPDMVSAIVEKQTSSSRLNNDFKQNQSTSREDIIDVKQSDTPLHDGSVESLYKDENKQEITQTKKVVKIKEIPVRHDENSLDRTDTTRKLLKNVDN